MTWNGRISIHDDLSRLHAQSRAADTSREIGYSSVTQGEGSLDLLTASGGVVASLGDQPDGRFGIAHLHGGALRFIPDVFSDLEAEDVSLSNRISGLGDRMVTAEGRLDAHNTRIHDNDGRISGLGDRMVSAEGALSSHGTRLGNIESKNAAQDSAISSHNTRINNAQSRADSAYSRAGTGIANAATAQSRADAAYALAGSAATPGQITTLANAIQALGVRVKALEDWKASLPQG